MIKRKTDPSFPSQSTLNKRLGNKLQLVEKVLKYCECNDDYVEVNKICLPLIEKLKRDDLSKKEDDVNRNVTGHVYLIKHGSDYKIGKSEDPSRRYKEIKVQMPYPIEEIHLIETDDPSGIEAYWHNRFKDKRLKGEWFRLSAEDIKIFKKRRFM